MAHRLPYSFIFFKIYKTMENSLCLYCKNLKTCTLTNSKDKIWDCSEYESKA